jgi:hypothetical protein
VFLSIKIFFPHTGYNYPEMPINRKKPMRKLLLFAVFLPVSLFAQVYEDFSDGDFTVDPSWYGDQGHFKLCSTSAVPEEQRPALQLSAPEAGISSMVVVSPYTGEMEWHFWVKLSLNTSAGNFARVYLLSSGLDLKVPLNGYFLQIGGTDDSVKFFRQDSAQLTPLLCLDALFMGNPVNALRFQVLRNTEGNWLFYADPVGGHSLELRGETKDLVVQEGGYFGIYCQYSSSNISKFYFDDFYCGPPIIDTIPPVLIKPFDIVVNEILFNPVGDGVDFVEIYNRCDNAINLKELYLASVKEPLTGVPDTQSVSISSCNYPVQPGKYLVLTCDPQKVMDQYNVTDPACFLAVSPFPAYNNDKGYVLLTDKEKQVIDGFHYSEEMHFIMLNSVEGVSLERICKDKLGDDPSNWHSAAETAGFATPGYQNSQYLEMFDNGNTLSVQPEVFSPDGDGRDDELGIAYDFSSPGKLISVMVFNAEGRLVKTLVNNEMPGTNGIYTWDGTLDDRTLAQNGIYIIYMEALGMDGKTRRFKKAAVLAKSR